MKKAIKSISIDEELYNKAQRMGLNVSALTEKIIIEKMNFINSGKNEPSACDFCSKTGKMETAETIRDNVSNALSFLLPDEKWICNSCLKRKMKDAVVSQ